MNITKTGNGLETSFHRKSTNTGLLLHNHSHEDKRYKDCLLTPMIHRVYQLSSTPTAFSAECSELRSTFLSLDYPFNLINLVINMFLPNIDNIDATKNTRDDISTIMVPVPFKDQQSAYSVKKKMQTLSVHIGVEMKPVFQTKKIGQILALKERKPLLSTNSAWFTNLNVICATQVMSGTPHDIYTSALTYTKTLQSRGILSNTVYWRLISLTSKFRILCYLFVIRVY